MRSSSAQHATPQLLRVGDLARLTGKSVRAIHLYEELGLLQPATRSSGGFRLYERRAVERVRWIDSLHGLGFSLQDMRTILQAWWTAEIGPEAMSHVRELFQRKLAETRELVSRFQSLERELEQGLAYLETCRACATPTTAVEGCVGCSQDHGMKEEPALLAGIVASPGPFRRSRRGAFVRVEDLR
jgi:DNA-binding transcriptional MerR regulator